MRIKIFYENLIKMGYKIKKKNFKSLDKQKKKKSFQSTN
jgi:hypothetical protein